MGSKFHCFRPTTLLQALWLRQRGFSSGFFGGGFGGSEAATILALLLQAEDFGHLQDRYSPLLGLGPPQLFSAFLSFLAETNLIDHPITVNTSADVGRKIEKGHGPVFFDGASGLNLLYRMSQSSYEEVKDLFMSKNRI